MPQASGWVPTQTFARVWVPHSYLTSRAIYRADRIASLLRRASITAMIAVVMMACSSAPKTESAVDSTATASDTVVVDTVGHEEVK